MSGEPRARSAADVADHAAALLTAVQDLQRTLPAAHGELAPVLGILERVAAQIEDLAAWATRSIHALELAPLDGDPACPPRVEGRCSCGRWTSDYSVWSDDPAALGGLWVAFEQHLVEARPTSR